MRYYHENYPDVPAIQVWHMVRIALEKCATVDEAVKMIKSVRIWFPFETNHLLISDAMGNSAIVEFDLNKKMLAHKMHKSRQILTNTAYQEGIDYIKKIAGTKE